MKTTNYFPVLFLTLFLISVCGINVIAGKPEIATPTHIQNVIKESIKYPEMAIKNGCCGSVNVTFVINDKGEIEIKSLSTDNEEIANSVKEQLKEITFNDVQPVYNEHYKITITFKIV